MLLIGNTNNQPKEAQMPSNRLKYPAPRREAIPQGKRTVTDYTWIAKRDDFIAKEVQHEITTYTTQPWSLHGVLSTIACGGWFGGSSQHDFQPGVAEFAKDARVTLDQLVGA